MRISLFTIVLIELVIATISCTRIEKPLVNGGGSGTALGRLVFPDGVPATNTEILLINSDYNPIGDQPIPDSHRTTTDPNGFFTIGFENGEKFNVFARNSGNHMCALIPDIYADDDTVFIPTDTIRQPGTIRILLPIDTGVQAGFFYIPGTPLMAAHPVDNGAAYLEGVPAGKVHSLNFIRQNDTVSRVIRQNVQVYSEDTTTISMPLWQYSTNIFLNTSATGANVSGTVTNFPLLVRLTAATFDFSQAKPDGADLRFTKADGTLLPFAVERYEAANRLAEVWVKVDTVLGNNSTQFITMLWGNPQAPAYSNPIGVFDTAEGYKAVWHMGDTADATIHGNTLQRSGAGNPCAVPGLIGRCMYFDSSHYFNAGLGPTLKGKTDFTISVWVKSTMSYKGYLISNKDSSNTGQFGIEVFETAVCNFWTWNPDSGKYQFDTYSKATVTDGQWHLLTGVRKDSLSSIYIDGVLDTTQSGPVVSLNSSLPTFIGFDNSLSDKYFKGNMDEAMILATARSADWIKLCFMNQKEGDALVSFK